MALHGRLTTYGIDLRHRLTRRGRAAMKAAAGPIPRAFARDGAGVSGIAKTLYGHGARAFPACRAAHAVNFDRSGACGGFPASDAAASPCPGTLAAYFARRAFGAQLVFGRSFSGDVVGGTAQAVLDRGRAVRFLLIRFGQSG